MITHRSHARRVAQHFVNDELDMLAREIALPPPDPFGVAHDCLHPEGHDPKMVGCHFVCLRCSKIFE